MAAAAAAILIFCATPSNAVDPHRMISQYARDRWTVENEFPGGAVSAITQTPDGYLWIGTDKGLFRFDGLSFRVFQQASPESLPIGSVQQLMPDNTGNLWVLLANTKLLRFRDGKFEFGREEAEVGVTAIGRRTDGSPLFSSLAYGSLTYRDRQFLSISPPSDRSATPTPPAYDDLSTRLSWGTSIAAHSLAQPDSAVTSMVETSDGRVWLGTRDKGLFYLDHGRISPVRLPVLSRSVRSLLPMENGDLWIGTERGLFRWNGREVSQIAINPRLRQVEVRAMIRDRDANVWVGTSAGLARINNEGVSFDDIGSHRAKPVTALFEDREGNLWIGRSQGFERLRETAFITYPFRRSQEESGGPVFVDATGRVWFASFKGGLQSLKQGQRGIVFDGGLSQDVVYSITGNENEIWVGMQRSGLTRLRYGAGRISARTYTVSDGLSQNSVYAVYRSRDGSVWAATVSAGISQFVDGHFKTYSTANGLPSNTVSSIDESPDGTMWFGTPNGLVKYSRNEWTVFKSRDGLPNDNITCLFTDTTDTLWIGTVSGLALLQSGVIKKPDSMPSSLREEILGIAGDELGSLWIATSNHILSVKRAQLSARLTESDVREYGVDDGLVGKQGVKRFQSVFADAHGKIWFSTDRGLAVVDPLRAERNSVPVLVQIESLSADGNSLDLEPPIQVPSDTHRLIFGFSGLSLSDPKRIQFRYKLEGFDKDWSEAGSGRSAIYTHVDWGSYTFRVMASNSSGIWNDRAAELSFSIASTWYQTRTFRVLLAASLLLGTWTFYRLRVHQLKRQQKHLRNVVETIPAMTFTALSNGSCTFVNKRWIEYTGLSVEESSGIGWQRAIHPEDLVRHSGKWRVSVSTGQPFEDEARFLCAADGEYRWFLVRGVPLRDHHGRIVKWYGTLTDIEDRKRAEEALRKSEFYLAEGQRLAHTGSWAFNPSGVFEYWSQELFKIYGLDPKNGLPTLEQYLATVHPQDREFMADTIKRMRAERVVCDVKMRIVRSDGELRYIRCVGVPVVEGEVLKRFLGTAIDITEQEQLTQELQRREAYLAEAQRLSQTGSWAWSPDEDIRYWSEECYRVLSFDPQDGLPRFEDFFQRLHPDDQPGFRELIQTAIREKAEWEADYRIVHPDGPVRDIHVVGHPVLSTSGHLVEFVGTVIDVTERKQAEQEREKLRQLEAQLAHINRVSMLGEMAASLAHEIKQPLAAAITSANTCVEWLVHEPPNLDRARAAAARIDKYGNRAAEIIDRIRSFYKKSPPRRELVDVNGITQEMLTMLKGEATRHSIEMRTTLAAELPVVMADRVQLQQVFMNLMLNAIEAMKDLGGGELTLKSQQEQDGQLLFTVTDTGPGLSTGNVDQIFSAFFTTKSNGSGMGLAISRSIVESHGGRLWATANEGQGASFHFTLPAHVTESALVI
jgi:PAS domain S-box-containing protein